MARYIDIDEAKKVLLEERVADDDHNYADAWECNRFLEAAVEGLNDLPTADVTEVKHGKWLPYEFGNYRWRKCSACGIADQYIDENDLESVRNYCQNCGARMDKVEVNT